MDYIEVKVTCAGDACELLAEELAELTGGCQIDDPRTLDDFLNAPVKRWDYIEQQLLDNPVREPSLRFFLSADEEGARILEEVRTILAGIKEQDEFGFYGSLEMEVSEAQSQDWENNWKQYYKPFCVGNRLFVCPSWEEPPAGRTVLRLDPGMAFGTGTHETTALCLAKLDEMIRGGERMLDVGTGSGILAIAALLLGAREADGVDIDPMCVRTAGENAALNGVQDKFTVRVGDLSEQAKGPYDVICANIVANAIKLLSPAVPALLAPDGVYITSGIIDERRDEVAEALVACGFRIEEILEKNGWVCIIARLA